LARVLIVEGEASIRLLIAGELTNAGFIVIEAKNADEARSILDSGSQVDLSFFDVCVPGSANGLVFTRQVRARYPMLPIVLTSGNIGPNGTGGVAPFVSKPSRLNHAIGLVFDTLGLSRPDGGNEPDPDHHCRS
jgi:DNA-binding NtrC family response regulator